MNSFVVIQESRILLQEPVSHQKMLSLKICIGRQIFKFHNLQWNEKCDRWQVKDSMRLPWEQGLSIELQIYTQQQLFSAVVVGQGVIDMKIITRYLKQEIKISLTYDGLVVGWLYCQVSIEGFEVRPAESKYLYIHKINLIFLQDQDEEIKIEIIQNTESVYNKTFYLGHKSKTIFPNLKQSVRLSDVINVQVNHPKIPIKSVLMLVDHVKRGKTSHYEAWLRNNHKNKSGEISIQYFLENLYFENDRKIFSRKAIIPQSIDPFHSLITIEKQLVQKSLKQTANKQIQQVDKRIGQVNNSLNKWIEQIKQNEKAMPCLKKTRPTIRRVKQKMTDGKVISGKEKLNFYLNPFQ